MRVSEADEWAIHNAATEAYFSQRGNLGRVQRYNLDLNSHDRVGELAESMAAEVVVAVYFKLDYNVRECKGKRFADVGNNLEIRHSKHDFGSLIIYPNDRDEDVAILVVGKSPTYRIAGWIPIKMARRPRYKKAGQESWWVSQDDLQPIENLGASQYALSI